MKRVLNILLIASGGIMAVIFGIIIVQEIMKMNERGDFVTRGAETLILFPFFVAGALEILVGVGGRKIAGGLTKKQIIPLIAAIVIALAGVLIFLNSPTVIPFYASLIGLIVPVIYLITFKKGNSHL